MSDGYYGPALPPGGHSCSDAQGAGRQMVAFRMVSCGLVGDYSGGLASGFGRSGHFSLLRHTLADVALAHSWDMCLLLIHLLLSTETFSWLK